MSKYVKEFKETGPVVVNVKTICKDWKDGFSINLWHDVSKEPEYTFIITQKSGKTTLKVRISDEQALEIIDALKLINVPSSLFISGSVYLDPAFVRKECKRLMAIVDQKRREYETIYKIACTYEQALF